MVQQLGGRARMQGVCCTVLHGPGSSSRPQKALPRSYPQICSHLLKHAYPIPSPPHKTPPPSCCLLLLLLLLLLLPLPRAENEEKPAQC